MSGTLLELPSQGAGTPVKACAYMDPQCDSEIDSFSPQGDNCWEVHGGREIRHDSGK